MALDKKVYGVKQPFSARNLAVYGIFANSPKAEKPVRPNQKLATSELFNCKESLSAIRAMNSEFVGLCLPAQTSTNSIAHRDLTGT